MLRKFVIIFLGYSLVFIVIGSLNLSTAAGKSYVGCGGDAIGEEGIIYSPKFRSKFPYNKTCTWRITVPENYVVDIRFPMFWLESRRPCSYDYLEIRDGHESTSPMIFRLCRRTYRARQKDIRSSSNEMLVNFIFDESNPISGFPVFFSKVLGPCKNDHGCQFECINTEEGYKCSCPDKYNLQPDGKTCEVICGGVIEELNGVITSPLYPEQYPPNKKCTWEIIAPPQSHVTLNFTHFDLEHYKNCCMFDNLTISSKLGENELINHGTFCGSNLPSAITSEANILRIEFNSDHSIEQSGFSAYFVQENCEYNITNTEGRISTPNFPNHYPSNMECSWLFKTQLGRRINLKFNEFDLQIGGGECVFDRIMIYDGASEEDRLLGINCGITRWHLNSSSNSLYMTFTSDGSIGDKGFIATHTTVCGARMTATENEQHFYSHLKYGEENYESNQRCDWYIQGPHNRRIRLRFLSFDLEEAFAGNCSDFLELVDGDDYKDEMGDYNRERVCGNLDLPEFVSTGPDVSLHFRSDNTMSSKGFHIAFSVLDNIDKSTTTSPNQKGLPKVSK